MDSDKKFKLTMSGWKKEHGAADETKTIEFNSLNEAEKFFWHLLKTDFLKDAVSHMMIWQGDKITKDNWIMDFGGFQYVSVNKPWLKKPYDKEEMEINSNGDIVKSNAWTKKEYEFAAGQAKNSHLREEILKNMNKQYPETEIIR